VINQGKKSVVGILVDAVDYDAAVTRIQTAATEEQPYTVSALAVHGVMLGATDVHHKFRLNHFDLLVPDGQPVRWALNLLHKAHLSDRVYGPELTLRTLSMAAQQGLPVYFYGSTPDILEALQKNLLIRFPTLRIAGAEPSKFRKLDAHESEAVAKRIAASGARILFVGLGCPRQEVFAYEMRQLLSMPLLAVGAAFAFIGGQLAQAPPTMQRFGLEWLYRFKEEPGRLWRRYLYLNPYYLALLMSQLLGRRYSTIGQPPLEDVRYG
jgi:N-acetylglucosaminyldiphosphoundecaprenol N-acetyl-beta-D-mannosaminyltransferase